MNNYLYPQNCIDYIEENYNIENFDWTNYIDKVYLLSIPQRKQKANLTYNELLRIGIDSKYIVLYWGITSQLCEYIYSNLFKSKDHNKECNILLNHYFIIKQAYDLGYNSIMVCEDDVRFLKNASIIKKTIYAITVF